MEYSPERQREFAFQIVEKLRAAGFEGVWAGGCVRDMLLGQLPKDYDVATNATPPEIRKLFRQRRTLAVGAVFGVIVVVGPRGAGQVDVATFRSDGTYSDGRRPDSVTFGTAEEDVKRRDFTINGLLYDPLQDRVLDYVGGQADLQAGIIRSIGDPAKRFGEDKLRLLRAVRFAARLGFTLESATYAAMVDMAHLVATVSPERIAQEMRPMLKHASRRAAVEWMCRTGLAETLIPELTPLVQDATGWNRTLLRLEQLFQPSFPLALAAWLLDLGPETTASVGERWRLANLETERVTWLVRHHDDVMQAPQQKWSQVQPWLAGEGGQELVALAAAQAAACGQAAPHVEWCREKLALPVEVLDPPPLITGHDLKSLNIPPGRPYTVLIRRMRQAQLDGEITTHGQAVEQARAWWAQMQSEGV